MSVPEPEPVVVWFGPEESPLYAVLHMPDQPPRGAVVLCPPLGREYTYSHATFVQLAAQLCRLGFAALRFDYRSTGDSFDRRDTDTEGFVDDVASALAFVRSLGAAQVAVVGMRLGANFASVQSPPELLDAAVLWDPCATGASYLREQRAVALLATELEMDPLDLPAFKLSADMAAEIGAIDLVTGPPVAAETGQLARKVLLLTRSEREADARMLARFDLQDVEQRSVPGQPELLIHGEWPVVPAEGVRTVAAWLDEAMAPARSDLAVPTANGATVEIRLEPSDSSRSAQSEVARIRERALRLGEGRLFGIETAPLSGASGPVCVFVSVANEHHVGPGALWVQLARRLAQNGFRSVRFDVNGFGDSPARKERADDSVHSLTAVDDVIDVAHAVSPEDPGAVVLFGLCSSGNQVLEAAMTLSPRGVCALNPSLVFIPSELAELGQADPRRAFFLRTPAGPVRPRPSAAWLKRTLPALASFLVSCQLFLVGRRQRFRARFRDGPGRRLSRLADAGTDVLLICGFTELRHFEASGLEVARRGDSAGRLHVEAITTLEHGLFPSQNRQQVSDLVTRHMLAEFGQVPISPGPIEDEAAPGEVVGGRHR